MTFPAPRVTLRGPYVALPRAQMTYIRASRPMTGCSRLPQCANGDLLRRRAVAATLSDGVTDVSHFMSAYSRCLPARCDVFVVTAEGAVAASCALAANSRRSAGAFGALAVRSRDRVDA